MLLIPLCLYRAEYYVSTVRFEYFLLDACIVRAIGEDRVDTVALLEREFHLPRRILIESLLNLFEDGYLAIARESGGPFRLTRKGRLWLNSQEDKLPPRAELEPRSCQMLMERLTGGLLRIGHVKALSEFDLDRGNLKNVAYKIPQTVSGDPWDEGRVRKLMRVKEGERVFSVLGLYPAGAFHYLPVDVDAGRQRVIGLPDAWKHLERRVLDYFSFLGSDYKPASYWSKAPPTGPYQKNDPLVLRCDDILVGAKAHEDTLGELLRSASRGDSLLIASPEADAASLRKRWSNDLTAALKRDVRIDLLWGQGGAPEKVRSLVEELRAIGAAVLAARTHGFGYNTVALPMSTSLAVFTRADGYCEAIFGGPPWLGSWTGDPMGIKVRQQTKVVSEVCGTISTLLSRAMAADLLKSITGCTHWRAVSQALAFDEASFPAIQDDNNESVSVKVIREYDFEALAESLIHRCTRRFLLGSARLHSDAVDRLRRAFAANPTPPPEALLLAGVLDRDDQGPAGDRPPIVSDSRRSGFLLIADDCSVIGGPSSYGGTPVGTGIQPYCTGLLIESEEIAQRLFALSYPDGAPAA